MDAERVKELLENLIDTIVEHTELDVAIGWMESSGFAKEEIAELGYDCWD